MSLSDREWTIFAIDSECDTFGHRRIVAEYNRQRAENAKLRDKALAKIADLEAKLAACPTTYDGVPVTLGMMVCYVHGPSDGQAVIFRTVKRITIDANGVWLDWIEDESNWHGRDAEDCWSSEEALTNTYREAAEAEEG